MFKRSSSFEYFYVDGASERLLFKHEIKNRILPFCVAVSVIEGEYYVDFSEDITVCVKAGETIFIRSLVKHTVRMNNSGKLTFVHYLCNYTMIDIFALANLDYFTVKSEKIFMLLNRLNDKLYDNAIAQKLYADKLICELVLTLTDMNCVDLQKIAIEPWLHASLQLIHSRLNEMITVEEVMLASGSSKTTFYKKFKCLTKISPREYIEEARFRRVSMLLLQGKKTKEIAKELGFNDISYFNKVFKRRYGMAPTVYKKKMIYDKGE